MKHYKYLPDFWGALFIIGLLLALEIVIAAAFYDAGVAFAYGDPRASVIAVLANGVIFTVLMHLSGLTYGEFFHPSSSSISSMAGVLFVPVLVAIVPALWWLADFAAFVASLFPQDDSDLRMFDLLMNSGLATLVAICLVAPFLEEMLFRGIILRGFLAHYPPNTAIILSALLFGISHLNIYQIPGAILIGCFLGWLFYRTKSLWPCIIAHAAYNFGAFLLYQGVQQDQYNHFLVDVLAFAISGLGIWSIHAMLRRTATADEPGERRL